MVELDGIQYDIKTPKENTDDLVGYINDYCAANDVKNSLGEVIQVDASEANPLYMVCYGISYLTTVLQKLIYSAGCSLNIAASSDTQLLNISDISGIKRTAATRTVIQGLVYASLSTDESPEACVITQEDTATISVGGVDVEFHPAYDVNVPVNGVKGITLVASQLGSYNISEGTITSFDYDIPGLRRLITYTSVPGQNVESISSLRARIQERSISGTQLDRAAEAIQGLEGVSLCNIYFNYSPLEEESIVYGDTKIVVPPRQALLLVQGWSNDIAKTFYRYLFCDTAPASNIEGVQTQNYTTRANQNIAVHIVPPYNRPVYIKIYVNNNLTYDQEMGIKDAICSLAGQITVGDPLDSVQITSVVTEAYPELNIRGAQVSLTGASVDYSYVVTPNVTDVLSFSIDNITVTQETAQ
jgi:hypothetical protein